MSETPDLFPGFALMWHTAAPLLAARYTVITVDLPGYGASFRPTPTADHQAHSKRALADDLLHAMTALGHQRFAVAGHDRGGRVAYRIGPRPARSGVRPRALRRRAHR